MLRFLRIFGPLAIVVGAVEIVDGIWGLVAEGTWTELRPAVSGTILLVAGIYMLRQARVQAVRPDRMTSQGPNGGL